MAIVIRPLIAPRDLSSCVSLQKEACDGTPSFSAPALVVVQRSKGLILGAMDDDGVAHGAIVDVASVDGEGMKRWFTAFRAVSVGDRNNGIGTRLRCEERDVGMKRGVELISWAIDPLRGLEAHIAFNKLGAVATGYERDMYGELRDSRNSGLATDRLIVEWWLTSPRVRGVVDRSALPYHFHLGLDRMEVATRTAVAPSGQRRLVGFDDSVCGGITSHSVILVEIPAKLDALREEDIDLARDWRVRTRDIFERMFASGHIITGLVHEGGRSFQLFERANRRTILEREG